MKTTTEKKENGPSPFPKTLVRSNWMVIGKGDHNTLSELWPKAQQSKRNTQQG